MPELPEVQTIVNDLKRKIVGRRLAAFWSDTPRIFPKNQIANLKSQIRGYRINKIDRRGKNILIYLSNGPRIKSNGSRINKTTFEKNSRNYIRGKLEKLLVIHPKLTGRLELVKWKKRHVKWHENKYYRAVFYLNGGWALAFRDVRKFGKIIFGSRKQIESLPDLADLGPDPLEPRFTAKKFAELINAEKRKIKLVLLDQKIIAGIGNIYSDEALWYAKIHPFTPSNQLTNNQLTNLYRAIREVLKKSLRVRGSSMRDYRDTSGHAGGYIKIRRVYDREELPCFRCGTKIKRIKINVRSAHFCPKCQLLNYLPIGS